MSRTILVPLSIVLALALPALAEAQLAVALDEPGPTLLEPPGALELPANTPSPGWERGLLVTAGAGVGAVLAGLGGLLVASVAYPACQAPPCGYAPLEATITAVPLTALLTIPASVFLFGNLSGRGADFGWTLLGSFLGALPGAALIVGGFFADQADRLDPGAFYASGGVLAGVGAITGSIIAFELSSRPAPRAASVGVSAGLGSLSLRGTFD
ncbi:MAG: hypothetical protein KF729_03260 [Sandaracinaceae bacterium]|nr:hypothetical protein [Sandaracinaceae bacterium]